MYRKPRYTDRLLDESSYNPTSPKATTIKALARRVQLVCDTPYSLRSKNKYLGRVFSRRTTLLDEIFTDLLKLIQQTGTQHLLLQWLYLTSGNSETISRILHPYDIRVARKPRTTHWPKLKTGTNTPTTNRDGNRQDQMVRLPDCIDEISRNLNTGLADPKRATRNNDANKHIVVHHQLINCNIDRDSQYLSCRRNYFQLLTLETCYTNLEQMPLKRYHQLTAPYKRLIHDGNETEFRSCCGNVGD